jgi:hypothetical protein
MFSYGKQDGRTRVNKVVDGKKNTHNNHTKDNTLTSLDKIYKVQSQLMKSGMSLSEYKNHIQGKVNDDMFHYKNITQDNVEELYTRYEKLLRNKDNQRNEREDERNMKRKQRRNFRKKRKYLCDVKRTELIRKLMKELVHYNICSSKVADTLSPDSIQWGETKKVIFNGSGGYLLDTDKEWCKLYSTLHSPMPHLFNVSDYSSMNQIIYNY